MVRLNFARFRSTRQDMRNLTALATACAALLLLLAPPHNLRAQSKKRRETSINRQRRNEQTIKDAYSHRWEIGLSGTYLRTDTGHNQRKTNLDGYAVTDTYYFNPKWSVVADTRGNFGGARVFNNPYNVYDPLISEFTFMAGPQVRLYRKARWAFSPHILVGAVRGNFSGGTKGLPSTLLGIYPDGWRAAASPGVNVDFNLFPNMAVRATPNIVFTTFDGSLQTGLGVNLGLVYRFGRQK
ncbi:MAG: hypothetical protein ACYCSN_12575 [Acidobacteriaceae bacterium]